MRSVPGVLVDRVNIGGNETGQQSNFASKGTRPQDASWTLDGVEITDMAATGASPTYFNYDNFEEIQVSTAGNDIKSPHRRHRPQHGRQARHQLSSRHASAATSTTRRWKSSNVPDELKATGVTPETADHNKQISDYGFDVGGPIFKDKAWFYGSYSIQDVRLVRRAGALVDRTQLKNPNVKVNWQATKKDMVSFLYFDGFKIKDGRSPGVGGHPVRRADRDLSPGQRVHRLPVPRPVEGRRRSRVRARTCSCRRSTPTTTPGFVLDPIGGLEQQAGRNFVTAQSYGSVNQSLNVRPQKVGERRRAVLRERHRRRTRPQVRLRLPHAEAVSGTLWPGNMILANERASNLQAQVFRQGYGGNRANYLDFYVGDTHHEEPLDARSRPALRSPERRGAAERDRGQRGVSRASFPASSSPATRRRSRGTTWSPRAGVTYALDEAHKTVARASFSRYAGQLNTGTVGVRNPSSTAGSATYRWVDLNGDHFAQANEVNLERVHHRGRRLQPAQPDGGDLGQRARSGPEGADHHERGGRRRSRADAEPRGDGELQLHADDRPVRQLHRHDHAARRRDAGRLCTPGSGFTGTLPRRHAPTTCRRTSRCARRSPPAATAS